MREIPGVGEFPMRNPGTTQGKSGVRLHQRAQAQYKFILPQQWRAGDRSHGESETNLSDQSRGLK